MRQEMKIKEQKPANFFAMADLDDFDSFSDDLAAHSDGNTRFALSFSVPNEIQRAMIDRDSVRRRHRHHGSN